MVLVRLDGELPVRGVELYIQRMVSPDDPDFGSGRLLNEHPPPAGVFLSKPSFQVLVI